MSKSIDDRLDLFDELAALNLEIDAWIEGNQKSGQVDYAKYEELMKKSKELEARNKAIPIHGTV